jgi:sulfotransferase family protein
MSKSKLFCPVFIVGFPRTGTTLLYRIFEQYLPAKCIGDIET